jgi:hypothetical protein
MTPAHSALQRATAQIPTRGVEYISYLYRENALCAQCAQSNLGMLSRLD